MSEYTIAIEAESGLAPEAVEEQVEQAFPDAESVEVKESGEHVHVADIQEVEIGRGFPNLKECPEDDCDSHQMACTTINIEGETAVLDGGGGISTQQHDNFDHQFFTYIECRECGVKIMEEGEIVHEAV